MSAGGVEGFMRGGCGVCAAVVAAAAAAASTTIAFTLTHRADPLPRHPSPVHRTHIASTPLRHAAPRRRSVAMDTRNDVTGNTPHQSRPAPPPATIATRGDGSGVAAVAAGREWVVVGTVRKNCSWDNVSEKKIKLIVYLLYDSILRPHVQLLALHPARTRRARHPPRRRRRHCSSFSRRQRAKPSPRVTSIPRAAAGGGGNRV